MRTNRTGLLAAAGASVISAALLLPASPGSGQAGTAGPDEVRAAFDRMCSKCHTAAHASGKALRLGDGPALRSAVAGMMKRGGLLEPAQDEIEAMAAWLLREAGRKTVPAGLAAGKALFESKCSLCHAADYAEKAAARLKSTSEWIEIVKKERARDPSAFTAEEAAQITMYLEWAYPPPRGEAEKALLAASIEKKCRLCHDLPLSDIEERLPADWDATVELMRRLNPFNLGVDEAAAVAKYFSENYALKAGSREELDRAETALLFRKKCSLCHSLNLAKTPGEYFEDWGRETERMRRKSPSFYTREEGARISAYLSGD